MIKIFLAAFFLVMTSFAQSQTTYLPGSQNFQSFTTTLKNSNSWAFIVDQNIELKFNPLTEVISFDLKKVRFQLNPSQFDNFNKGLRGKVCKLEFSISKVSADGTWSNSFSKQTISIADKFEPEPNKLHEVVVPPSSLKFPTSLLNEKTNQYRVTLEIYTERPRLAGSPCDASVPIHTPYLTKYLNEQLTQYSQNQKSTEESGWVSCSRENNFCAFDGIGVVRFGVDGKFKYKDIAFEVGCTTAQFGDPAPNVKKNCEYKLNTLDKKQYEIALKKYREQNNIEGWRFCAIEGEVCTVNQNSEVRYGISNTYNTKLVAASVTCDNNTFGDPTPGFLKKCFVKDQFQIATPNIGLPQKSINAYALVIGNSAYAGSGKLTNPVNDARSIAAKLRELGFKVTEVTDADRNKLVSALALFSRTASDADLSLLFYAGHGVQITGTNYMLPVDLNLNDLSQAPLQGISLNDVVEKYLPGKTKLVFLDACRDNPLMQVANRGVSRGLAPINVSEGTLISYATKDGSVAQDGDGKNSPFTSALLEHIGDPDDIAVVLRKVREKVMKTTGNKQQPWEYGSLTGGALVLSAIKPK